jgi:hypothetical protein
MRSVTRTARLAAGAAVLAAAIGLAACGDTKTETVTTTVAETVTTPPVTVTASAPVPPSTQSCGRSDFDFPEGGGSSAIGIKATGVECAEARRIVLACQKGNLEPGWDARFQEQDIVMTAEQREISFMIAGGGGCVPQ